MAGTLFENNLSPYLTLVEGTEPSAPAAGQQRVYIDSTTHKLKRTNSSGTDTTIEGITDDLLPWHVQLIPAISTPDATVGTWGIGAVGPTALANHGVFYTVGSAANSGSAPNFQNTTQAQNDAVAWDVVLAAGTWDCHFWVVKFSAGGIITLNQDGGSMGTVDTYAATTDNAKVSITGWSVATTGKKRMQILLATKNGSSSGYRALLHGIEFRRTA